MTHTLALCLDAPMQSWGLRSRFQSRDTAQEPTKSGVIGLLAAALGIARDKDDEVQELAKARMGVRVDREGLVERDYHTVNRVPNTEGKAHRTAVSHRYYLADAVFLVALEHEDRAELLRWHATLNDPVWPIYFGRKAFVPARPLVSPEPTRPCSASPSSPLQTCSPSTDGWRTEPRTGTARRRPCPTAKSARFGR